MGKYFFWTRECASLAPQRKESYSLILIFLKVLCSRQSLDDKEKMNKRKQYLHGTKCKYRTQFVLNAYDNMCSALLLPNEIPQVAWKASPSLVVFPYC
jgi:hypothetical protein